MDALAMRLGMMEVTWNWNNPPVPLVGANAPSPAEELKEAVLSKLDVVLNRMDRLSNGLPDLIAKVPVTCRGRTHVGALNVDTEVVCLAAESMENSVFPIGEIARATLSNVEPETELGGDHA